MFRTARQALYRRFQEQTRTDWSHLTAPPALSREVLLYGALTLALSTVWLWPHLTQVRHVPDRGDPAVSAWRFARLAHQLATDPRRPFDGNIFHPRPLTLTYSDPTVLQGLLAAPAIGLGVEPIVVANVLTLAAFPLCGLAFFFSAWRLTADPRAGLVAGVLGAWHPFHGEHYSHLELQWFMFVPLSFVALATALVRPTPRAGLYLGTAVGAQWLASMYIGLMLVTVLVPFGLALVVGLRIRPTAPLIRSLMAGAAVVVSLSLVTTIPYLQGREQRGDRPPIELVVGSAEPSDYLVTHRRMASYQWRSRAGSRPEHELYPGTTLIVLAVMGLALAPGALTLALAAGALAAFDLSLGVNGLTYPWLVALLPYRGMRSVTRFSVVMGGCLVLLGGYGAHALLRRLPHRIAHAAAIALALVVLLDLRMTTTLVPYWRSIPGIYSAVQPDMVLEEFPTGHDPHYMYFSTAHWARLLGGYSGHVPVDLDLNTIRELFPSADAFARLRQRGATHITYNCWFERSRERCANTVALLDATPGLALVRADRWNGATVRLYRIERR